MQAHLFLCANLLCSTLASYKDIVFTGNVGSPVWMSKQPLNICQDEDSQPQDQ